MPVSSSQDQSSRNCRRVEDARVVEEERDGEAAVVRDERGEHDQQRMEQGHPRAGVAPRTPASAVGIAAAVGPMPARS